MAAQGLFRLCDDLARHRLDQRFDPEGEKRAAPASGLVFDGEVTRSPATSPSLHLPSGQAHLLGCLVVFHLRLLVKPPKQPKALHDLDRHSSSADRVQGHLHEIVGKSTRSGAWSWRSGVLFRAGIFSGVHLLLQKSPQYTTTLFCETDHLGHASPNTTEIYARIDRRLQGRRGYGTAGVTII